MIADVDCGLRILAKASCSNRQDVHNTELWQRFRLPEAQTRKSAVTNSHGAKKAAPWRCTTLHDRSAEQQVDHDVVNHGVDTVHAGIILIKRGHHVVGIHLICGGRLC